MGEDHQHSSECICAVLRFAFHLAAILRHLKTLAGVGRARRLRAPACQRRLGIEQQQPVEPRAPNSLRLHVSLAMRALQPNGRPPEMRSQRGVWKLCAWIAA
jgi:hypothetical protein